MILLKQMRVYFFMMDQFYSAEKMIFVDSIISSNTRDFHLVTNIPNNQTFS